jgi:hypothetical protein
MPTKKRKPQQYDATAELLRDLLIVELAKVGVPQPKIRTIVGCDMHRVSRVARFFKQAAREAMQ